MAPTIIRVKRKLDEHKEIDSKIVLNCKKQKINEKDVYSQFAFVGTVEEKEDVIPDYMLKLTKKEAENIVQRNKENKSTGGLTSRLNENLEKSKEQRFKVVNLMRSTENSQNIESNDERQIILDVEKDDGCNISENETTSSLKNQSSYVYDIYLAQDDFSTVLQADLIDINDLSILDYNDYLYSCPRLTNETDNDELQDDYDEDSNDENNWRNDYPDEDDFSDESIDERAMRRAMQNFDIENDLSSEDEYSNEDDGNEGFVYSIDAENEEFDDDYDYSNGDGYGSSYARYKKRIMKDMESGDSTESEEE